MLLAEILTARGRGDESARYLTAVLAAGDDEALVATVLAGAAGTTIHVIVPASAAARVEPPKGSTAVVEVRRGGSPERVFANPDRMTLTPR